MDPMYQVSVTFCTGQEATIFEQVDITFEVQSSMDCCARIFALKIL